MVEIYLLSNISLYLEKKCVWYILYMKIKGKYLIFSVVYENQREIYIYF